LFDCRSWYTDASLRPDNISNDERPAGLGIFLLDFSRQLKCLIKTSVQANSVLQAEASAMALATKIIALLGIKEVSFIADNQLLVNFFNGTSYDMLPHWSIKSSAQSFLNAVHGCKWKVLKISRGDNVTTHILAAQGSQLMFFGK